MRLLEHQCKQLLGRYGIPFTTPHLATTAAVAEAAFLALGGPSVMKAQVPFGGRGKLGAVRIITSAAEAIEHATDLLGMEIRGYPVSTITLEPKATFTQEYYVGITWDLRKRQPVAIFNPAGGVDVESGVGQAAQRAFDPRTPLTPYQGRELAAEGGLAGRELVLIGSAIAALSRAFLELDALTLEINPFVVTAEHKLLGLDAHVELDDDAAYRLHDALAELGEIPRTSGNRPPTAIEEEAARIDASDHRGVAGRLVEFPGDIALLIGGGGASLTVFDAVLRHGGQPANYCEIGGNPTAEKVAALTQLLLSKPGVRHLAVIMNVVNNTRADVMAHGVIQGIRAAGLEPSRVLSVFRIPGSWEDEATAFLAENGVTALGREVSLDAAAALAVQHSRP